MKKIFGETVRAAGILLFAPDREGESFLLMRHRDRWDLPKGHCEENETFEQTALRETEEETGIPMNSIRLDQEFSFDLSYQVTYKRYPGAVFDKHVRYFVGYLTEQPVLKLTEHESSQWFGWTTPPPSIQAATIDPLLADVARHKQRP